MLLARKLQITLITLSSWTFLTWKNAEKQNANGVNWQKVVLKFGKKARLHWLKQFLQKKHFLQKYRLTDHSLCATHLPGPVIINCMVTPNLLPRKKNKLTLWFAFFPKMPFFPMLLQLLLQYCWQNYLSSVMGVGRIFSREGSRGFPQIFFQGAKSGEICFLPLEIENNNLFCS